MAKTIDLLCTHAHHTHIPSWSFLWRVNVVKLWFGRIFFCTLCSFYIVGCVFLHIISNFFRFHQIQFRFFFISATEAQMKNSKMPTNKQQSTAKVKNNLPISRALREIAGLMYVLHRHTMCRYRVRASAGKIAEQKISRDKKPSAVNVMWWGNAERHWKQQQ